MSMADVGAAVELGRSGNPEEARARLAALWDGLGPDGDAAQRCAIAHFLADLQETPEAELLWDERALAAAPAGDPAVHGFFPSLHLSLADVHRRLGNTGQARHHLALAGGLLDRLADDDYGTLIRGGFTAVTEALAAGSTAKLV